MSFLTTTNSVVFVGADENDSDLGAVGRVESEIAVREITALKLAAYPPQGFVGGKLEEFEIYERHF